MDVHDKLDEVSELVEGARSMPMSGACILGRGELLGLLDELRELLPEELRHARLLLSDREAVVEEGRREAERLRVAAEAEAEAIVSAARAEREALVAQTAVVQEARRQAEEVESQAQAAAEAMRREAEGYVDDKLAGFEVVLSKTLATVHRGRARLGAGGGGGPAADGGLERDSAPLAG